MDFPWIDGPKELLQHAIDHLENGGDFDRRMAMVSIDNAVELTIKTYLSLPKRGKNKTGPSRKELNENSESFPLLLDLLEKYLPEKLIDLNLDDIEWYHRIRNQLYHSGNGITVDKKKVETYYQLALILFETLFESKAKINKLEIKNTMIGDFLTLWVKSDSLLRTKLPPRNNEMAYSWKRNYLSKISPEIEKIYSSVAEFRNILIYSPSDISENDIRENIMLVEKIITALESIGNSK